jgi:Tol biopolymer transport system component
MNRRKAILAATVMAAAAGASLGHATAPAKNGRIAFQRYRLADNPLWAEIFVANADGTGARKITHTPRGAQDSDPDWAPDGSRIVFQRCGPREGECFVWSLNVNGSGERRLSPRCPRMNDPKYAAKCASVGDHSPAYSPDGRYIAFVRDSGRLDRKRDKIYSTAVFVADANLRHARRVFWFGPFRREPIAVAWSPDGQQLAFVDAATRAIYLVRVRGKPHRRRVTPRNLRAAGDRIDWSPDGSRILFRTRPFPGVNFGGNLYTVRPNGTGLRQLTHYNATDRRPGALWTGSYSPDGSSILFATFRDAVGGADSGFPDILVMSVDGTNVRPVTRSRNWDGTPDWGPARLHGGNPVSPDEPPPG